MTCIKCQADTGNRVGPSYVYVFWLLLQRLFLKKVNKGGRGVRACVRADQLLCLLACLPALPHLPAPVCLLICLPACLPEVPAPACLPACLPA